ncbi:hypothetical protein B5S28_g1691 [[Candida] boidinii]|nr:hypothetical protein B5S28_g1691 [[Candida] boidinii]OWB62007.1 hypothetical protein B5S29_g2917 [[Candida] boidinii]
MNFNRGYQNLEIDTDEDDLVSHSGDSAIPINSNTNSSSSSSRILSHFPEFNNGNNNGTVSQFNTIIESLKTRLAKYVKWFYSQSITKRILIIVMVIIFTTIDILAIVYHQVVLSYMISTADYLKSIGFKGEFLLFLAIFIISFPPMAGYSMTSTIIAMTYGLSIKGFLLISISTIIGSCCSFLIFQKILIKKSKILIEKNSNFKLINIVLTNGHSYYEKIFIIFLIRLCPTPYSFTNGALASLPDLSITVFFLANVLVSPKFLLVLYVGQKLRDLNRDNTNSEKFADLMSAILPAMAFSIITYVLYKRVMQRLRELNESQIYNGQDELQDNHNNSLNDNIDIENQIPNNQWQKDIGIHHQNSYHNDNNNDNDDDDERLIL